MKPYYYALAANMAFAIGTIFFTHYSRKVSSIWMNTVKALVAMMGFFATVLATTGFHDLTLLNFSIFFVSGFIALGIGDLFLLNAFKVLGPGRTLMLFAFQPLVVGTLSYLVFGQVVAGDKLYAIAFFILCLFTFSYEGFKSKGSWEVNGLLFALCGMALDGTGVIITRYAFDMNPAITGIEGNFYRCFGAVVAYIVLSRFIPIGLVSNFKKLNLNSRFYVLLGSFFGTYLSLSFYLEAIRLGHLASIAAISITSVIFASFLEAVWERKKPSPYLAVAFVFFGVGMWILVF